MMRNRSRRRWASSSRLAENLARKGIVTSGQDPTGLFYNRFLRQLLEG
jgi:hypothetical protein